MARPSHKTDQRLLAAGKDLLAEKGLSGLSLRQVAERAQVNLGMFHYHFKSKEVFVDRLLQETYEEFFASFTLEFSRETDSEQQLKAVLRHIAGFIHQNRKPILGLAKDVLEGNPLILDFVRRNFHRHILVMLTLARRCRKEGKLSKEIPLPLSLVMMAVATVGPVMVLALLERLSKLPQAQMVRMLMTPLVLKEKNLERRIDLIFHSLAQPPASARKRRAS